MTTPQASGVHGWLAVFRLVCLLGGAFYLLSLLDWAFIPAAEWESLARLAPAVVPFRLFSRIESVALGGALWWTFYLLVRPRPTTPLWALFTLSLVAGLGLVGLALGENFISSFAAAMRAKGEPVAQGEFTEARTHAIVGVLGGLVWMAYFLRSKRVEKTWGRQSLGAMLTWIGGGFK